MNKKQLEKIKNDKGFITAKALLTYGVEEDEYSGEDEMFDMVHNMRSRIVTSRPFDSSKILAAILFEQTMDSKIDGKGSADYLGEEKGIVPLLKVVKGLAEEKNGVQLMKANPKLDDLLDRALDKNIFGTKMRSVINKANEEGIKKLLLNSLKLVNK